MANKTIPDLGQVFTATDLDFLVITNSGETTTSKITRQDLLSGTTEPQVFKAGDAADSIVPSYFPSSAATASNTTYLDKVSVDGMVMEIADETISSNTITPSTRGTLVMGGSNTINTPTRPGLVLGDNNTLSVGTGAPGTIGNIVLGYNNNISGVFANTNLVMGGSNSVSQTRNIRLGNNGSSPGTDSISIGEAHNTGTGAGNAAFGTSHNLTGNYHIATGNDNDITAGNNHAIVGGTGSDITSTGSNGFIGGGSTNKIQGGNNNFIGGASNATIGGGSNNAFLGGGGTISNVSSFALIASAPATNVQGGNDACNGMIASQSSTMGFNGAYGSVMLGGYNNYFKNFYGTFNEYRWSTSVLLGGSYNKQADDAGTGNGAVAAGVMLGGKDNTTKASSATRFPTFISTESSVIQGGSSRAVVIGGTTNTIDGKTDAVMIGTSGRTALYDETLHAENNHIYKTESFGVVAGGSVSGNVVVDCSLGSIYTFSLGGNITQLDFQNLRSGQRLEFIVENTTYNITGSALIDGVSGNVYAKNGIITISNNSITHYTATYDGTRLFLDEEGQFDAV